MEYKLHLNKLALRDLREITDWYGGESIFALERFVTEVRRAREAIAKAPHAHPLQRGKSRYRWRKIKKFPYKIVFSIYERHQKVFVATIVHTKRNPGGWLKTLKN